MKIQEVIATIRTKVSQRHAMNSALERTLESKLALRRNLAARPVAEVERRLSVVEELEAVVSGSLQGATRLRQLALPKALSCQVGS